MAFFGLIVGFLLIAAGVALFWFVRPIDGKVQGSIPSQSPMRLS
jgi:hypothetical protein